MDKNELRYFLTEAMGECCPKFFKKYGYHKQIDFLTWEGFGKLWEWARRQEWWKYFIWETIDDDCQKDMIDQSYVDPEKFAKAIADFLQKK